MTTPPVRDNFSVRHDLLDPATNWQTIRKHGVFELGTRLAREHAERLAAGCGRKVIVLDDYRRRT